MKKNLVIGIDFGSDSVRALLVGIDGRIVTSSVHAYRRWGEGRYCDPAANRFRQHPLDYLEGIEAVVRGVLKGVDASAVGGIAIDTTGSTPGAVDASGTPLALLPQFADDPDAMFFLWKDHTSAAEADWINKKAAEWASKHGIDYRQYEGKIYSCEWFWSKLLYVLRVSPAVREAAASWVEHSDWITGELVGRTRPDLLVRNRCAAGHKAMWHASWGGLPPEEFFVSIDPLLGSWRSRLFGATATADQPVGTLTPEWAARLGLPEDVVVGGSGFDAHFGAVGAGVDIGEMVSVFGTSTCDIAIGDNATGCIGGICGQVDGSVVPGFQGIEAGQASFGDVYAWFKRFLSYGGNEISLPKLEAEAAQVAPGADGIAALDWFNGRRSPDVNDYLRGAVRGLSLGSTPPAVFRALVEATVFGLRAIVERLRGNGVPINSIAAIGGISRKSPLVMQIAADVLNLPVRVSSCDQVCALGAAIFAAVAAGIYPDTLTAMRAMSAGYDRTYQPDPERVATYEKLYRNYLEFGRFEEQVASRG